MAAPRGAAERGLIVAVKGLGGYHLACDAANPTRVSRAAARKHRDQKPFAVMVRSIDEATAAWPEDAEASLLTSLERPIVLVRRREECRSGAGGRARNPLIGLLLPTTPLHHLLLHDAGGPLVMTSGNLATSPSPAATRKRCAAVVRSPTAL